MDGMVPSPPWRRVHANPLDCGDLLAEVLLRLPPHPSSFLRASLVCRRWRRLLRDPAFLRRVRAFHRAPPVLGLYRIRPPGLFAFVPIGEAPYRVPAARFALRDSDDWVLLGCNHGRLLLRSRPGWTQLLVWDPVTGHRRFVRLGQFGSHVRAHNATVLGDRGGLSRREGSFRVAFAFTGGGRASACLYSSETGAWGRLITAEAHCDDVRATSGTLVGGVLYWMLEECGILELHLGEERLTVLEPVPGAASVYRKNVQLMEAEGGMLGFAGVTEYRLQLWAREAQVDGSVSETWVLRKTIGLHRFVLSPGESHLFMPMLVDVDEGGNFVFLWTVDGIYMVSLDAAQFKKVSDTEPLEDVRPYSSFYIAGGFGGGEGEGDCGNSGTGP
ncbi:unnamed protein product [Urochloa decumbens]|uniref:F-box domain-containing protein n=1 Tax=Urochloa decumbens TaxID=240449 RepID=A0ABC8WWN0_9POAL